MCFSISSVLSFLFFCFYWVSIIEMFNEKDYEVNKFFNSITISSSFNWIKSYHWKKRWLLIIKNNIFVELMFCNKHHHCCNRSWELRVWKRDIIAVLNNFNLNRCFSHKKFFWFEHFQPKFTLNGINCGFIFSLIECLHETL